MNGDSRSWYQPPEVMTDGHHKSGIILVVAELMTRDGLVDVQTYNNYIGDAPIQMWNKYKEIIVEFRNIFEFPDYMIGMEYLADELDKYIIMKGWGPKGPILYVNRARGVQKDP